MQSSFKIIKEPSVVSQGSKAIVTQYIPGSSKLEEKVSYNSEMFDTADDAAVMQSLMNQYEEMGSKIVENAQAQSVALLNEAMERSRAIEKEAYEKAYNTGYNEGMQQGYKDAYEQNLPMAKEQAEALQEEARNFLLAAKKEYEKYLEDKKEEILQLAINMAEHVLKREVERADGIDHMLIEAFERSVNSETIIIRTNTTYCENIKKKITYWKERFGLKADIFVLEDNQISLGNAIIEKNNGKMKISIDDALENIWNAIQ